MKSIDKLKDKDFGNNTILANNLYLSMNTLRTKLNNNVLVIGGSGSGKRQFVAKPNLLQMNCSYVVTDCNGELLRSCGKMLEDNGYDVRVFNLLEPEQSLQYNPFAYFHSEEDIIKFVKQMIRATEDKRTGKSGSIDDPFMGNIEAVLCSAIFSYIWLELAPEQQNFLAVMEFIAKGVCEENETKESELDIIFRKLEEAKGGDYFPVKQYNTYKLAPRKTAKQILISVAVRFSPFNVVKIKNLMATDTIDMKSIGDKKTAVFIVFSPFSSSYDFIISSLLQQLFDELNFQADSKDGKLPIHVRFLLDEFALFSPFEDFGTYLLEWRIRNVSAMIFVETIAQIRYLYKSESEKVVNNCDSVLYLGSCDHDAAAFIARKIVASRWWWQWLSEKKWNRKRDIMIMNLTTMSNRKCVAFIRGYKPFYGEKFMPEQHSNYHLLQDE